MSPSAPDPVPPDTNDHSSSQQYGYWGNRTDPLSDWYYQVAGGAGHVPPQLTACQPTVGPTTGGTVLHLGGSGLTGVLSATLGQEEMTDLIVEDDTKLTAVTPAGEGANQTVRVANAAAATQLLGIFSYQEPSE